jgi:carbonic anhydrase
MWAIIASVVPALFERAAAAGKDRLLGAIQEDWNPAFYADYWPGVCTAGKLQSPLNIQDDGVVPMGETLVTNISMPIAQNPIIKHNGHAIEVQNPMLELQLTNVWTIMHLFNRFALHNH